MSEFFDSSLASDVLKRNKVINIIVAVLTSISVGATSRNHRVHANFVSLAATLTEIWNKTTELAKCYFRINRPRIPVTPVENKAGVSPPAFHKNKRRKKFALN